MIRPHAVAVPAVLAHGVVGLDQVLAEREHQQDRVLGGELQRRARHAGDRDAALCRRREIDRIGARAEPLDQLQLRVCIHHGGIDAPRRKISMEASLPWRRSSFADIGMSETPSPG